MSEPTTGETSHDPKAVVEATPVHLSPTASPPSEDGEYSDPRASRKREREVSLEPLTPKTGPIEIDSATREHREVRTPKKNRTQLDVTAEEEDVPSPLHSPPLNASPPHELRVRQISQGVEDIHWQNKTTDTVKISDDHKGSFEEEDLADVAHEPTGSDDESQSSRSPHTQPPELELPPDNVMAQSTQMIGHLNEPPAVRSQAPAVADNQLTSYCQYPGLETVEHEDRLLQTSTNRTASPGPAESLRMPNSEPFKRPRDDADQDDNPRETKRPSPPPDKVRNLSTPTDTSLSKLSGFMAYASPSSPFAAVQDKKFPVVKKSSIFGSSSPSPSPLKSTPVFGESTPVASLSKDATSTQAAAGTAVKRTGFEAFSGLTSPFGSVGRSKSSSAIETPWNLNRSPTCHASADNITSAFSPFASEKVRAFATPAKRAREASPNGRQPLPSPARTRTPSDFGGDVPDDFEDEYEPNDREATFGEKLRATGDDPEDEKSDEDQKPLLTEKDIETGEEEEETVRQVRGKLFSLSPDNQWKERGTGILKLNVRASDGGGARLVMRKEAVYTVILNVTLFRGMRCFLSSDPRYIRFSAIEAGQTTHYNLRVANAKVAEDLLEDINNNVPL